MPSMPPLPTKGVSQSPPFSHGGVDYFGPLFIKSRYEKQKGMGVSLHMSSYKSRLPIVNV